MPRRATAYTVKGRGPFPIDMLRCDRSHPAHESPDSALITHSFDRGSHRDERIVNLERPDGGIPNIERWLSFGWHVTHVRSI